MITPDVLATAYELLRVTAPFKSWKLPVAGAIQFVVSRDPVVMGKCWDAGDEGFIIEISSRKVHYLYTLLETMAHEMIHLRQGVKGTTDCGEHGAEFKKLAAQVCRYHGFDPKAF